jgi:hypothetical protein
VLQTGKNNKREVLYNGGEPKTFSYAEIAGMVKVGIIF